VVQNTARKTWTNLNDKDQLVPAIQAWRDAHHAVEAGTAAHDALGGRATLRHALQILIALRESVKSASTARTLRFLTAQEAVNDAAITALDAAQGPPVGAGPPDNCNSDVVPPEVVPPAAAAAEALPEAIEKLKDDIATFYDAGGPLALRTDTVEKYRAFVSRKVNLLAARHALDVALSSHLRTNAPSPALVPVLDELQDANTRERVLLFRTLKVLCLKASARAKDMEGIGNPPESSDIAVQQAHRAKLDVSVAAHEMQEIALQARIDALEKYDDRDNDHKKTVERLRKEQATVQALLPTLHAAVSAVDATITTLHAAAQPAEAQRIAQGNLSASWVPVAQAGEGAMGTAQTWVKQNRFGVIIDRLVIKDTATAKTGDTGWSGPRAEASSRPWEVDTMYRIQEKLDPGRDNVVQILTWRRDPTRTRIERARAAAEEGLREDADHFDSFRIYIEWCGHGNMAELQEKSCFPSPFLPEPFLWALFHALVNACRVMDEHWAVDTDVIRSAVVHNDMTLPNVFLSAPSNASYVRWPRPKLGDFGLARIPACDETAFAADRWRGCGTADNVAPEQALPGDGIGDGDDDDDDDDDDQGGKFLIRDVPSSRSNVWGMGNIMWSTIEGHQGDSRLGNWVKRGANLAERVVIPTAEGLKPGFSTVGKAAYSKELRDLVSQCLNYQPSKRPSVQEVEDAIERELKGNPTLDAGLKYAPANSPVWNDYMLRIVPDYVQKGLILGDVWSGPGGHLSVPPPTAVSTALRDDYGGATGTDLRSGDGGATGTDLRSGDGGAVETDLRSGDGVEKEGRAEEHGEDQGEGEGKEGGKGGGSRGEAGLRC
jgi:serine/threonine protein kinase